MNKLLVIMVILLTPSIYKANANVGVEKLLDSYMVAEVETQQPTLTDDEIRHFPFTIQIASYLNEKDAVSHVEELRPKEKETRYFPAFVRGQIWYKVAIGKFPNRDDAEAYRKQIAGKLDEPFAVVVSLLERPDASVKAGIMTASTGVPTAGASTVSTGAAAVTTDVKLNDKPRHPSAEAAANENDTDSTPSQIPSLKSVDDQRLKDLESKPRAHASKTVVPPATSAVKTTHATKVAAVPKATPASKEKSATGEHFYSLQVGAYPTEDLAKQKLSTMALTSDVYFSSAVVKGQSWVRVMTGKFKTKKEAEEFQKTKGDVLHEAFVRRVDSGDKYTVVSSDAKSAQKVAAKPANRDADKKAQKVSADTTPEQ